MQLNRRFVFLLSLICAVTVSNLYLAQPLLAEIARTFGAKPEVIGIIATLAQIGYGTGVLLIVPLGDMMERKSLMLALLASVSLSLCAAGLALSLPILMIASLVMGITTVVPQIIIPYAASLAPEGRRASILGTIQSGLLIGILLARTVSGTIAEVGGWRSVYFIAAGLMVLIAGVIIVKFPKQDVRARMSYLAAIGSMKNLLIDEPVLQKVSFQGFFSFGAFSIFWTALTFLLEANFNFGPGVAGLFGIVGVAGAAAASIGGRLSDTKGTVYTQILSAAITLASFLIYLFAGHSIIVLVIGVILMDAGVQASHVACQAEAFSLDPNARSRLNGVYMFFRFLGGACGSTIGAWAWNQGHWIGVCAAGITFCVLTFVSFFWKTNSSTISQGAT